MKKSRIIQALTAQAEADRQRALMALDLLENQAVGIGDHTANDFMKEYIQKTGDKPLFNRVPTKRVPKAWIEIELAERLTDLQNEMAIQ